MEELDGDEVRVSFKGRLAERDIVQVNTRRLFTIKDLPWVLSCDLNLHREHQHQFRFVFF